MQWSVDLNFKSDSLGADLYSLFHRDVSPGCHLDDTIVHDAGKLPGSVNPQRFWRKDCEMSTTNSESNLKLIKVAGRYPYPDLLLEGRSFSGTIWINGTAGADSAKVGIEEVLERIKLSAHKGGLGL